MRWPSMSHRSHLRHVRGCPSESRSQNSLQRRSDPSDGQRPAFMIVSRLLAHIRRAASGGAGRGMEARRMMPPELPGAERDRQRDDVIGHGCAAWFISPGWCSGRETQARAVARVLRSCALTGAGCWTDLQPVSLCGALPTSLPANS